MTSFAGISVHCLPQCKEVFQSYAMDLLGCPSREQERVRYIGSTFYAPLKEELLARHIKPFAAIPEGPAANELVATDCSEIEFVDDGGDLMEEIIELHVWKRAKNKS